MKDFGFEGDEVFLAGHSLGGVFAQDYAYKHADDYSGVMLMGAGIQRKYRELNDEGLTHWTVDVPTLTISGTKDGLYRITRVAEGWWH